MKLLGTSFDCADHGGHSHRWAFLQLETDEGLTGVGEWSCSLGGIALVAKTLQLLRADLVGEDANDIERLWHKMYRHYFSLGPRGVVTAAISSVDIALWDIKGKALNRPVYDLLGGRVRDRVLLYSHPQAGTPEEVAEDSVKQVAEGWTALKTDPFRSEVRKRMGVGPGFEIRYMEGALSAEAEETAEAVVRAMREAVGPKIEILIDAHGNFNVPTAVRLARRLTPYKLTWFEEPCPPESFDALRQIRESVEVPICVGERLFTRFDFVPIFRDRLADYIMPDVVLTGGISELKKIATMAESYYIPVSPHNPPGGPVQVTAAAHVMMTVPNFYRQEFARNYLDAHNSVITPALDIRNGCLFLSNRPGLGVELDTDFIKAHPDPDWC